ncbi:MAG: iron transporter, partial [Morganella morganii]
STSALALEYPLGQPVIKNGMEIQGVYLQPITMAVEGKHEMHHLAADKSDIHLEADIHAVEENPNGFAEGDWIPYLKVDYKVTKLDDPKKAQSGTFMAMVASDGPHYGENLKLDGYGKYRVEYRISPPSMNDNVAFGRHIDKETGVAPWFEPFDVSWDFEYAGTGRKGSY